MSYNYETVAQKAEADAKALQEKRQEATKRLESVEKVKDTVKQTDGSTCQLYYQPHVSLPQISGFTVVADTKIGTDTKTDTGTVPLQPLHDRIVAKRKQLLAAVEKQYEQDYHSWLNMYCVKLRTFIQTNLVDQQTLTTRFVTVRLAQFGLIQITADEIKFRLDRFCKSEGLTWKRSTFVTSKGAAVDDICRVDISIADWSL